MLCSKVAVQVEDGSAGLHALECETKASIDGIPASTRKNERGITGVMKMKRVEHRV